MECWSNVARRNEQAMVSFSCPDSGARPRCLGYPFVGVSRSDLSREIRRRMVCRICANRESSGGNGELERVACARSHHRASPAKGRAREGYGTEKIRGLHLDTTPGDHEEPPLGADSRRAAPCQGLL